MSSMEEKSLKIQLNFHLCRVNAPSMQLKQSTKAVQNSEENIEYVTRHTQLSVVLWYVC